MFNWQINGWILKECFGESQAGGLNGLKGFWLLSWTEVPGYIGEAGTYA